MCHRVADAVWPKLPLTWWIEHKLLGMRIRKWPKQEPVNNREDRGVCADSQSQRQDDSHSE
jgi:hypothetical protein